MLLLQSWLLLRREGYDKAIADYTEAVRFDPKLGSAYYNRGFAYQRKSDKAKAEADFAQAKKLGYKAP
jgi:Flp pilus assembly protein TadD